MVLTIELSPEDESRLRDLAANRGIPPEELVIQTVKQLLPIKQPDQKNLALIRLLEQWRREDETDDPEELERAEAELQELKAALNANRRATGERLLFS